MSGREKTSALRSVTGSIEMTASRIQQQPACPVITADVALILVVLVGCADLSSPFGKHIPRVQLNSMPARIIRRPPHGPGERGNRFTDIGTDLARFQVLSCS